MALADSSFARVKVTRYLQVFVVLSVVFGGRDLTLLPDPLLELGALQKVLVPEHGLHKALLARCGEALQSVHLLGQHLLLAGDGLRVGVLSCHHSVGRVPHLVHNASIRVQLQLQRLQKSTIRLLKKGPFSS